MTESNPYATPSSDLDFTSNSDFPLHEPRAVAIGQGVAWLGAGFDYFKRSAGQWILTCIVGFVLMVVLSILPFLNIISSILTFVWVGGLMLGVKAQHDGEGFKISYLFAGFKQHTGSLILLSVLMMVIVIAVMAVTLGQFFFQLLAQSGNPEAVAAGMTSMVIGILLALTIMIPVYMAFWFAPLLIVIHNVPIVKSLQMSFVGCLKNILPFLVYGILLLLLYLIGMIPLFLGLLVVVPMFFGSVFAAYKDIFVDQ